MRVFSFSVKRGFRYCLHGVICFGLVVCFSACSGSSRKESQSVKPVKSTSSPAVHEEEKIPTYNDLRGYLVPKR